MKEQYNSNFQNLQFSNSDTEPLIPNTIPIMQYYSVEYDEQCEDSFKIDKVLPLKLSSFKITIFIFLNIITLGIINLILKWFPSLNLYFLYSQDDISTSKFIGIFSLTDGFTVEKLSKIPLPSIPTSNLLHLSTSNIVPSSFIFLFEFKLIKYALDPQINTFKVISFKLNTKNDKIHDKLSEGLSNDEYEFQRNIFGTAELNIKIASIFKLLYIEFSDPFYLFQVFSVILWINNEYYAYSYVILGTTLISLCVGVYETRTNLLAIQRMAKYDCEVSVYRGVGDSKKQIVKQKISSNELVPGDIFELPSEGMALPCDALLLQGVVIMNEAMLTGESTPMFKCALPINQNVFDVEKDKKHIIYAGTKVIQKRNAKNMIKRPSIKNINPPQKKNKVLTTKALVLSTGFNTTKGGLIRSILFPKKVDFKFKQDSIKYIIVMSFLSFTGFIISLPFLLKSGLDWLTIAKRSLDLVTTTVPPALPACLSIGISYALSRLKIYKISCINRERVNIAGKVNLICFDKTGTLTEDTLDIGGFLPMTFSFSEIKFDNYFIDCKVNSLKAFEHYRNKLLNAEHDKCKDLNQLYIECLACCHSITRVNDKLIGDPIDVKMFEATGWILTENKEDDIISSYVRPSDERDLEEKLNSLSDEENDEDVINSHYEIGLVRCFEFSSALQRMSVIVKNSNEKYFKIFVKGSPEKIIELCKQESIPQDFSDVLRQYTSKGCRVLALACKLAKMDYLQSQTISREVAEKNLILLGLLIVHNKLKGKTSESIQELQKAKLRMVMATGDNILTAIAVSKECKLIQPDVTVYTCEIDKEKHELHWNLVENYTDAERYCFIEHIDDIKKLIEDRDKNFDIDDNINRKESLTNAFPAESYNDYAEEEEYDEDSNMRSPSNKKETTESEGNKQKEKSIILNIDIEGIPHSAYDVQNEDFVFAISGPTFESLYNLSNKYIETKDEKYINHYNTFRLILKNCYIFARMSPEHKTMLVQSLRDEQFTVCMCGDGANDCGALKSADVGVSLSTEEASIAAHFSSAIFDISCLINLFIEGKSSLVTSIQTFKYMMLYSLIQFYSVTLLMIFGSYLTDNQFLTSDLFIIFPIAFLISRTESENKLTHQRPTGALISVPIISSILIQMTTMLFFQLLGWYILHLQEWNENNICMRDSPCYANTVIFLVSNFQYLISAIAFSITYPFKKSMLSNSLLVIYLIVAFMYSIYLVVLPDEFNRKLLKLMDIPEIKFRYWLLGVSLGNFVVCYYEEKWLVPMISKAWDKRKYEEMKRMVEEKSWDFNLNVVEQVRKKTIN